MASSSAPRHVRFDLPAEEEVSLTPQELSLQWISAAQKRCIARKEDCLPDRIATGIKLSICNLPLDGSKCDDGGPRFISPASPDELHNSIDDRVDPEILESRLEAIDEGPPSPGRRADLIRAGYMADIGAGRLRLMVGYSSDIRFHGGWLYEDRQFFGDHWYSVQRYTRLDTWLRRNKVCLTNPKYEYDYDCYGITWSKSPTAPHLHGLMYSKAQLREGSLKTGEVSMGLGLIKAELQDAEHSTRRFLPATVFSAAGWEMRVVQFWYDRERPRQIFARCSRILDFDLIENHWDDWLTLCCYFVGEPVVEEQ